MMADMKGVAGTSAGSIMATTVSLGYTAAETRQIIGSTDFKSWGKTTGTHSVLPLSSDCTKGTHFLCE